MTSQQAPSKIIVRRSEGEYFRRTPVWLQKIETQCQTNVDQVRATIYLSNQLHGIVYQKVI